MLVRAAQRRSQGKSLQHLRPLSCLLTLPWLCPAQLRHEASSRPNSTFQGHRRAQYRVGQEFCRRRYSASRRRLATAASLPRPFHDEQAPFDSQNGVFRTTTNQPPVISETNLSSLRRFDPNNPLVLNNSVLPSQHRPQRGLRPGNDTDTILRTLEACLRVSRYDRANVLLRRLSALFPASSPEVLAAFNEFLHVSVENIISNRKFEHFRYLQKWFEVEMRGSGIEPDATSYALLIKASLQVLRNGQRMVRTVRRYMDMAAQSQCEIEVLNLPILSDAELHRVTEAYPMDLDGLSEPVTADQHIGEDKSASAQSQVEQEAVRDIPEVRSAEQKGLGLEALRKSIALFGEETIPGVEKPSSSNAIDEQMRARQRQERLETDVLESAIERWREEHQHLQKLGMNTSLQRKSLGALMWDWQQALEPIIRRELELVEQCELKDNAGGQGGERCHYGPLLRILPPQQVAAVTILATMNAISLGQVERGIKISSLVIAIGSALQDEVFMRLLKRKDTKGLLGKSSAAARDRKVARMLKRKNSRISVDKLLGSTTNDKAGPSQLELRSWDVITKARVGAVLLSGLIEAAKLPVTRQALDSGGTETQSQPVFSHTYRHVHGKRIGFVVSHSELNQKLSREPVRHGLAKHLPMIVEPENWAAVDSGGYLQTPVRVVRAKEFDSAQNTYIKAAEQRGDLDQVFAGLDVLAKTAWRINNDVLEVMIRAWNSGKEIANMPPEEPDVVYPPEPDSGSDPAERYKWVKEVRKAENYKSGLHSNRCFQNFQLEIARAFRRERLYFPHSLDFRGRAYPVPPHLNHMGADHCRGLLMFADPKELGEEGLNWLKVHIANLYGFDKASFRERQDFTAKHIADIYDSAEKPLEGQRWWLQAEDPWQCLAACIELKKALSSPDPARFRSRLPVHQDGTCNGLQHYAALGGDILGARQVNLMPNDRPVDVYTGVAEIVKQEIAKDAARDFPAAKVLEGNITRKVVKQTVMTNVYGVTFTGASAQVRKQLEALMPNYDNPISLHYGHLSSYVAKLIFKALSTMFGGAREIQFWLGQCGSRITTAITPEQLDRLEEDMRAREDADKDPRHKSKIEKSLQENTQFQSALIWTTPLRMPVVQPYRTSKAQRVASSLQSINIRNPHASDPIDRRRQLQGFPPNFIHSLDATHMLLSALQCNEQGLTFAAVHDSFWTHAADVDKMNSVLRDAFVRIHAEDVIGRLETELKARYRGHLYACKLRSRSKVSKDVKQWREVNWGQTSMTAELQIGEILLERKRLRLLESEDVAEQEEGRQMVTPGSIYEASSQTAGDAVPDELAGSQIGEVSSGGNAKHQVEPDEDDVAPPAIEDDQAAIPPKKPSKADTYGPSSQRVWLPLTFPPKPPKGDFDIQKLRESQYFFS